MFTNQLNMFVTTSVSRKDSTCGEKPCCSDDEKFPFAAASIGGHADNLLGDNFLLIFLKKVQL